VFARLTSVVLRQRILVIAGFAAVTALAAWSATRLQADFTFTSFMGSDDPEFRALQAARARWGADDTTLTVTARAAEPFTSDAGVQRLRDLEDTLRRLPAVRDARSFATFPVARDAGGLLEVKTPVEMTAADRRTLLEDPLVVPALLSEDARSTALLVELATRGDDILSYRPLVREVRDAIEAVDDLELAVAGIPAVRAELVENIMGDQVWFVSLSMLCSFLLLILLFRRAHALAACAVAASLPAVWLMGLMAAAGEPFGLLSQVYPALIPVIAIADAIHVITRFHEEARGVDLHDTGARRAAIIESLRHTGPACLTTTLTTAIGFGSLAIAEMPVLRNFGLYAAAGCFFAFVAVVVIVPVALDLARAPPPAARAAGSRLERIARASLRRPLVVLAVTALLAAGAGLLASRVSIDNRLGDSLVEGGTIDRAQRVVDEHLGGVLTFEIEMSGPAGSLFRPDVLAASAALTERVRAVSPTRWAAGPADVLLRLNGALTGERKVPGSTALAEQLLALVDAQQMSGFVDDERAFARIVVGLPDIGGVSFAAYRREIEAVISSTFAPIDDVDARVTGVVPIAYEGFNRLSGELASSLGLAAAVIALVLLVMFRSAWICLVSAPPNLLPLVTTLAVMGAVGWRLDPAATVVFSVALGIAVDDTIHVLARVRERLRAGHEPNEAIVGAISTTGRALLTTSTLLGISFAVFSISSFPLPRVFGSLMAAAIGSALILDVTLLPALLSLGQRFIGAKQRAGRRFDVRVPGAATEAEADRPLGDVAGDAHSGEDG
jgi:predicted RND superfamily exporter protein